MWSLGPSSRAAGPPRPIDVTVPQAAHHRGVHRATAVVDGRTIWFESADLPLAAASEAFGAALLVPALHAGRPLRLAGHVCEAWGANLTRLTDAFRALWYPDAPRPLAVPGEPRAGSPRLRGTDAHVAAGILPAETGLPGERTPRTGSPWLRGTDAPVAAGILPAETGLPGERTPRTGSPWLRGTTALCFSGGVDAFHTLLASGHEIDTLVYVVGYDVRLRDRRRAEAVAALVRSVAAETGRRAVVITTNLRRHPLVKATPWVRAFGGPLAAVGHLLGPAVGRILLSSDGLGFEHPEVGSRPSADHLHGSARLVVEHVAGSVTRLEKIARLSEEPLVQRHLRVCWQRTAGRLNCGRCEKCVRTMLALDACGTLGRFAGFDHGTGLVAAIDGLASVDGVVMSFYRDLLGQGLSAAAAAAVRRLLERSPVEPPVATGILPVGAERDGQPTPRAEAPWLRGTSGTRHRLLAPAAFADVCQPLVGRRVGYVRPEGNVGDHLIEVGMMQLFAEYGIRWRLVSPATAGGTDGLDLLVFGGGGNMGTRYTGNHALRTQALATGLPVVILPQSFTSPEDRPFARVFVRERGSLGLRPDGILAPDLALGLATAEPARPDRDLGVYLRRDQERGGRKPLFARDPVRLFRDPFAYLAFAARHRRIVTDRLHFAVAGLHAGRDVTLVANDYHKNRSMHETWLADLGCRFAATPAEALGRRAA